MGSGKDEHRTHALMPSQHIRTWTERTPIRPPLQESKLDGLFPRAIIHPVMEWHYSKNGVQMGPVSREEILQKKQSGEVLPTDLVWKAGMADWVPLAQIAELSGGAPAAMPSLTTMNGAGMAQKIPNYLWQSIAVTVLCCLPFGIVAIIYATKVDGLVAKGDITGAMAASKSARLWINVSVGIFILFFIFGLVSSLFTSTPTYQ
jgi:hypothetical protein